MQMSLSAKEDGVGCCHTPGPMLREPILREGQYLRNGS